MVVGVGIDTVQVSSMRKLLASGGNAFEEATFSKEERQAAYAAHDAAVRYAGVFAVKEAVYKSLRVSPELVDLSEIEVLTESSGAPRVILHGRLLSYKNQLGIRKVHVSISYEEEIVTAFAVAETCGDIKQTEE